MVVRREMGLLMAFALVLGACVGGGEDEGGEEMSSDMQPAEMENVTPRVVLETNLGDIVMELDGEKAPQTVASIVEHVEADFYDGLIFHRVIPGFMIQAGGFTPEMGQRQSSREPIPNEADNGLKNVRGSVAMARTNDPHSAKTQFFINLTDNPNLDFREKTLRGWGYAVFGHVVEGMDVVDSIAAVRTQSVGQYGDVPVDPVVIERAYIQEQE